MQSHVQDGAQIAQVQNGPAEMMQAKNNQYLTTGQHIGSAVDSGASFFKTPKNGDQIVEDAPSMQNPGAP